MAHYGKRDLSRLETRAMFAEMQAHPYVPPPKPVCHCGAEPAWCVNSPRTRGDVFFCAAHEGEAVALFKRS